METQWLRGAKITAPLREVGELEALGRGSLRRPHRPLHFLEAQTPLALFKATAAYIALLWALDIFFSIYGNAVWDGQPLDFSPPSPTYIAALFVVYLLLKNFGLLKELPQYRSEEELKAFLAVGLIEKRNLQAPRQQEGQARDRDGGPRGQPLGD